MMFSEELRRLRQHHLLRQIKDRSNPEGPAESMHGRGLSRILLNNTEFINFASNDYLGLACNKLVMEAAKLAIHEYGVGSGSSRLLAGGTELHKKLEEMLAEFKETEAALLFNSGYTANVSTIPSIATDGDIIFSDELNHASIIDGCRLSKARRIVYRHSDVDHLAALIKKEPGRRKIVITDTIFSMDGDIAPIRELFVFCRKHNAILYLDDAHGTGVLGEGSGALRHFDIKPEPWIIQMGTLSKAIGSFGAFIAADRGVIEWLINTGRGVVYSTTLPPCIIGASIKALSIIQTRKTLVKKLWQNRAELFNGIKELGFDTLGSETPIIPIVVGDTAATVRFSEKLAEHHIYAPAIRQPTVKLPRIRIAVTATHTREDIRALLSALSAARYVL